MDKREIDLETQCEIIPKPQKRRVAYGGIVSKLMMFSAMSGGFDGIFSPSLHTRRCSNCKDGLYYISLSRKEQKLPYETKQDLKKLKLHLKLMGQLSEYEKIIRYTLK